MSKKSIVSSLIIGLFVTVGLPFASFFFGLDFLRNGFPLSFTEFNFLGSETDYFSFFLDTIFWSIVVLIISRVLGNISRK